MNSENNKPQIIKWRLHLKVTPEKVYEFLATDKGRAKFWAESAVEENGFINFEFPNGQKWQSRIIEKIPSQKFVLSYFAGGVTTFILENDGNGGTDLTLTDENFPPEEYNDIHAGWVSVLMSLKAAAQFGVDLRNHNSQRSWDDLYVEN